MPLGSFRLNGLAKRLIAAISARTANIFTAYGNSVISSAQSKFGNSSGLFDGSGDYLRSADNDNLLLPGDFTIEFWIRWITVGKEHYVIGNRIGGDYSTGAWQVGRSSSTGPFQMSIASSTNILLMSSPSNNVWYHFAIVRQGSTVNTYRDGTFVAQATNSATLFANFQEIVIGGFGSGTSDYFYGYLDEFRISNIARYTNNFTPSTTAFTNDTNTLCLLHFDGTKDSNQFVDDNGLRSPKAISVVTNASLNTTIKKFGTASLYTNTSGRIVLPASSDLQLTGNFTIEFWSYFTTASNTPHFSYQSTVDTSIWIRNSTNFEMYDGADRILGTPTLNTWIHWAIVRNGSTITPYRNGIAGTSWTNSSTTRFDFRNATVGSRGAGDFLVGYIDEFRISNIARYTSGFSVPTAEFTNDQNTIILLHMNGTNGSIAIADDNTL